MSDQKLDIILNKLGTMDSSLNGLKDEIDSTNNKMESESKELKDAINNTRNKMESESKELKDAINNTSNKIDAVTKQVVTNAENITNIKHTVHHIANIQSKQEDTINILARRSIDQEAAIKSDK